MRIGGTEMVIKNIIDSSDPRQYNMSVFCIEAPLGPWGQQMQENGLKVYMHPRQPGFDRSLISAIANCVKANNIDIVHCHQYTPWVYGTLACALGKTRVIFTEHGRFYPDSSSWKRRFVNPILAALTHKITAISKATKQALVDYEFLRASKIEVIYNGITGIESNPKAKQSIREELGISANTFLLGTVARLDPIKNHLMMIKGVKRCINQGLDVHLVIVGDGEMRGDITELISTFKLHKHVSLVGYKTNPSEYLNAFDLYLLTSFSEGTSMTLLEAMSIGLPSIATKVGGNPEIIVHNENGRIIASDDDLALYEQISALMQNNSIMQAYSDDNLHKFDQHFTGKIMCQQYANLYAVPK